MSPKNLPLKPVAKKTPESSGGLRKSSTNESVQLLFNATATIVTKMARRIVTRAAKRKATRVAVKGVAEVAFKGLAMAMLDASQRKRKT